MVIVSRDLSSREAGELVLEIDNAAKAAVTSVADVAMLVGEQAMRAKCWDIADRRFRHVLVAYSQPSQTF
jgi:hypothetical protein